MSGAFVPVSVDASKDAITQTLKLEGGMLTMSTPTGQSYSVKVGGPPAPFRGDPTIALVKVVQAGPRELVETDMRDGKAVSELHMTVSADGKTLLLRGENFKSGRKTSAKALKV